MNNSIAEGTCGTSASQVTCAEVIREGRILLDAQSLKVALLATVETLEMRKKLRRYSY